MLYKRKLDRWLLIIVPALLIAYASSRPRLRLRVEMPEEFVDLSPSMSPKRQETEKQLAQQYWHCVLSEIQWRYPYGSDLPESPPAEFRIEKSAIAGSESALSRIRYWHQLQKVWVMPTAWTTSRSWSLDWLIDPLEEAGDWLKDQFANAFSGR